MPLPDRELLRVSEVARELAPVIGTTQQGARNLIYRGIESIPPKVTAVQTLGGLRLSRNEAQRLLKGTRP